MKITAPLVFFPGITAAAVYQGIAFRPGPSRILHLQPPELIAPAQQRDSLDLLKRLNQQGAARYPQDSELQARLNSYELAYRMESAASEAVDLSKGSHATKELYGLNDESARDYGTNMLIAATVGGLSPAENVDKTLEVVERLSRGRCPHDSRCLESIQQHVAFQPLPAGSLRDRVAGEGQR
jgi:Protein of unknown function (DUF1501)